MQYYFYRSSWWQQLLRTPSLDPVAELSASDRSWASQTVPHNKALACTAVGDSCMLIPGWHDREVYMTRSGQKLKQNNG